MVFFSSKSSSNSLSEAPLLTLSEAPLLTIPEWCPRALNKSFLELSPEDRQLVLYLTHPEIHPVHPFTYSTKNVFFSLHRRPKACDKDTIPTIKVIAFIVLILVIIFRCSVLPIARLKAAIDANSGQYWVNTTDTKYFTINQIYLFQQIYDDMQCKGRKPWSTCWCGLD